MLIKVCAFTEKGMNLANTIFEENKEWHPLFREKTKNLHEWTKEAFEMRLPILFIGACGIAVRAISPFVSDKLTDSPVLVADEKGQFVIPILSGHVGGANEIAKKIAAIIGATPVITTATDVEGKFSVDVFAQKEGLRILNRDGIRYVSSRVLNGEKLVVSIEESYRALLDKMPDTIVAEGYPPVNPVDLLITTEEIKDVWIKSDALCLVPKRKIVGIGCKKGKSFKELKAFVENELGIGFENDLYAIASIDMKKEEMGLMALAGYYHVPFITYSAEELLEVQGDFCESEFVQNVTGVSNVCERAALKAAGKQGKIIRKKTASDGMTLAVAEMNRRYRKRGTDQ